MKLLKDILYGVGIKSVFGSTETYINTIQFDSRKISNEDLFVAIKGIEFDGHDFIQDAINRGANTIVHEDVLMSKDKGINYVQVKKSSSALAMIASNYYNQPSANLQLIGVTGTNGKTTVASLLYDLFKSAGFKVGLISTVKIMVDEKKYDATHTTPNPILINYYLNEMNSSGVEFCFMEVSSHGIDQNRIKGLVFSGGIFTNLSHDHLDYHKTFSLYRDVKKSFFDSLPNNAFAILNADDKNGLYMGQNTKAKIYTYALRSYADYKVQILENQFKGLLLKINSSEMWVKLIGTFNAYNLVSIFACADILGLDSDEILKLMSNLDSVDGRFNFFTTNTNITLIIDYAHTPDALKNVLETINDIRTKNESLITVIGCGGDRDKDKRPKMGKIASVLSSKVIFTSDNPRHEDPELIISEMEEGVEPHNHNKIISITNRKQAIKTACQLASSGDIILVAGKGHETYQDIKGEKTHFSDVEVAHEFIKDLQK